MKSITTILIILSLAVGCIEQASKPSPSKPIVKSDSLEQIAYESFQARDKLRAERLRELADDISTGRVKYDGQIMSKVEEIGAEASRETWRPVAVELARLLDVGDRLDSSNAERAVRDLAHGAERASK